jgi:hypothetical protein
MFNLQRACNVTFELKMGVNTVTDEICLFSPFHLFEIKIARHQQSYNNFMHAYLSPLVRVVTVVWM